MKAGTAKHPVCLNGGNVVAFLKSMAKTLQAGACIMPRARVGMTYAMNERGVSEAGVDGLRANSMRRMRSENTRHRLIDLTVSESISDAEEFHGDEPEQVGTLDPVTGLGVGETLIEAGQMNGETMEDENGKQ